MAASRLSVATTVVSHTSAIAPAHTGRKVVDGVDAVGGGTAVFLVVEGSPEQLDPSAVDQVVDAGRRRARPDQAPDRAGRVAGQSTDDRRAEKAVRTGDQDHASPGS